MPINILMPALSPTMEKGNLAKWLKKEGDRVKSGDVIAEIETDKATMEVEAVDEGVLAKILVAAGSADVPVNQPIAVLAGEGEDVASAAAGAAAEPAPAKASPAAEAAPRPEEAAPAAVPKDVAPAAPVEMRSSAAPQGEAKRANGAGGGRVFASPLARRLAKEAGLDIARIQGSGPHGRIVQRDVEAAKRAGPAAAAPAPQPAAPAAKPTPAAAPAAPPAPPSTPAAAASDEAIRALYAPDSYETIPHDTMRKVIARRLTEAKQTIPHFYLTRSLEIDALLALREQINAGAPKDKDGNPAFKLSVNDFVIKAWALALLRVPDANVTWTESALLRHRQADVGVAVAIPGGLIVPVIRDAGRKTLSAISAEMKDYAARARTRRLKPEEYAGGASAISNLGMYGITDFAAVINPPHATILAVGVGEKRPVVKNDALAIATMMSVTLSTDHRAVDGALGSELLAAFVAYVEAPMTMLV